MISQSHPDPLPNPPEPPDETLLAPDRRLQTPSSSPGAGERRRGPERRATPRLKVELECEEQLGSSRYFRITSDLSTFGLSTRHGVSYPAGTVVRLALYLPGEEHPVDLLAEVVGPFNLDGGLRMAFRNPTLQAVRRIHRYLSSRLS